MKSVQFTSNYFDERTTETKIKFLNELLRLEIDSNIIQDLKEKKVLVLKNGICLEITSKIGQCIVIDNKKLYVLTANDSITGRNSFYVQSVTTILNHFDVDAYEKVYLYVCNKNRIPESIIYDILISNYIYDDILLECPDKDLHKKLTQRLDLFKLSELKLKTSKRNKKNNGPRFYVDNEKIVLNFKTFGANSKQSELMLSSILKLRDSDQMVFVHMFDGKQKNKVQIMKIFNQYKEKYSSNKVIFIPYDYFDNFESEKYNLSDFEDEQIKRVQSKFVSNMIELDHKMECVFCNIKSNYLLEAAHIYSVKNIKENNKLSSEQKINFIHDGNNGAWMCSNHHKMYDKNIITYNGDMLVLNDIDVSDEIKTDIDKAQKFITNDNRKYFIYQYKS